MATLYISEYAELAKDSLGRLIQAPQEPALATQTVAISDSSAQSSAFNANTKFIQIHTDVVCHIAFGTNPTATTSTMQMAAGETAFKGVVAGHKVAVIEGS